MLKQAQEKSSLLSLSIPWIEGDCRHLQLARRFALIIMAGNAFQAMLTKEDQNQLLSSVKQHLLPGGLFVFDTRNPNLIELTAPSVEENWHTYKNRFGDEIQVSGYHAYDPLSQIATYTTIRKSEKTTRNTHIQLRYTFPQELDSLLANHGFKIIARYGAYNKQDFEGTQSSMINVCCLS